ncbi:ribosome maturation factor RimM [Comamonadaceae bacterium OH2545_COT-014]|nr:ribosome maturation factor RimM [Comamonadaceae bacterium OH2545_COT-014]
MNLPGLEPAELPADAVEVGRVLDAWGIKGWFKIQPYSASAEALFSCRQWYLLPPERGARHFSGVLALPVKSVRDHADAIVASAPPVADRTAAEALKGARIFISRAAFPPPQEGEYYWVDLLGLAVVNREGVALGQVKDLLATGPQTTLVLAGEAGPEGKPRERLIPFVDAYVDEVDLAARRMTVDWQPDY